MRANKWNGIKSGCKDRYNITSPDSKKPKNSISKPADKHIKTPNYPPNSPKIRESELESEEEF